MDIPEDNPSGRLNLTATACRASIRSVVIGLVLGGLATAIAFLLGIPMGAWFLQPDPDGTPDRLFDSLAAGAFLFCHFSLINAVLWPNRGTPWVTIPVLLMVLLGTYPVASGFAARGTDFAMAFPFGLVSGLLGIMFYRMFYYGIWPPFRIPGLFLRRTVFAPIFWVLLCTLGVNACDPCNFGKRGSVKKAGDDYIREAVSGYLERGHLPADFRAMGIDLPGARAHGWKYWKEEDPFHLSLRFGSATDCGEEYRGDLRATWSASVIQPPEPVRQEAMFLFRMSLAYWLRTGSLPGNQDSLGIPWGWGSHGPWRIRALRVDVFPAERWELVFDHLQEGEDGTFHWQEVLRLEPTQWTWPDRSSLPNPSPQPSPPGSPTTRRRPAFQRMG